MVILNMEVFLFLKMENKLAASGFSL